MDGSCGVKYKNWSAKDRSEIAKCPQQLRKASFLLQSNLRSCIKRKYSSPQKKSRLQSSSISKLHRTYLMISYSIGTSSKLMLWIPSYASYRFDSFTIRNSWRSPSSKNCGLKWHVIKYGLDWIGKTWTVSCDVMLGLQRMSKSSFTDLLVKKVSLRWDACLCIFCESCWSLLNEFMTDWIDKTWINNTWSDKTWINKTWSDKTWSDKTWINKTLLLARTLRRRACKLRMRRNSKKLYFSGYPSIQIPLLFSFCVTDVLTSS